MNAAHAVLCIGRQFIAVAGVALVVPLSGLATEGASPEALRVKDAYVTGGRSFTTVAALEEWVAALDAWATPSQTRSLVLDGRSGS
jgi:hypothetical protein